MFVEDKKQGEVKTVNPIRQMFLNAADYMEKNGWCQHHAVDEKKRVCLLGALRYGNSISQCGEFNKEIMTLLASEADSQGRWGSDWNDQPRRTKEEVVALLRKIGNS